MSTDIELLPLYAELQGHPKIEIIKHYARANVAHATAAKDAEIEALKSDLGDYMDAANYQATRAERLAEALQKLAAHIRPTCSVLWDEAQAALRDHDQVGAK